MSTVRLRSIPVRWPSWAQPWAGSRLVARIAGSGTSIARPSVRCSNGSSATTTALGSYSITDVAPGSYRCTAGANRYRSSTRDVTVISNRPTTANFDLDRS